MTNTVDQKRRISISNDFQLKKALQSIIDNTYGDTLETAVAHELINADDSFNHLQNILNHGCISGMVSSLVYYTDTGKFYDKHYNQIEILRHEYEDMGCPMQVGYDLKNDFAWFAFEVTTSRIAEKLELNL